MRFVRAGQCSQSGLRSLRGCDGQREKRAANERERAAAITFRLVRRSQNHNPVRRPRKSLTLSSVQEAEDFSQASHGRNEQNTFYPQTARSG